MVDWLQGWNYRKSHVINPSSGAGTGYQVQIIVSYYKGTDSGNTVYLGGKCNPDFSDIRFTASDGTTLLSYWIEEMVNSDHATVWVKINDDLSTNPATIYIYYGNPNATSQSNGDYVFPLFDDFLGSSLNTNKWTVDSGIVYSIANSLLKITDAPSGSLEKGTGLHYQYVPSQSSFELRLKGFTWTQSNTYALWRLGLLLSSSSNLLEIRIQHHDDWASYYGEKYANIGSSSYESGVGSLPQNGSAELIIRKDQNNNVYAIWNGTVILGAITDTATLTQVAINVERYSSDYPYATETDVDAIIWRKYVNPEPSHGSWGSEESLVPPSNWLSGWQYRKSHVINPSSGAGTGYQIKITVHYGSGTDSGSDVYLNGKCNADFSDIRFTDSSGSTLLNYWIESYTPSDNAVVWVKLIDDISSNPATIYIYYGNPNATSQSNGDYVFPLFDDFLGSSLNTNKWTVDSGIVYSIANSLLKITDAPSGSLEKGTGLHYQYVPSQSSFELRLKGFTWTQSNTYALWRLGLLLSSSSNLLEIRIQHHDDWASYYGEKYANIGSSSYESGVGSLPQNGSAELIIRKDQNNNVYAIWNGTVILGAITDTATLTQVAINVERYSSDYPYATETDVDAIIWRKYVNPEPTQGSWGSEETSAIKISSSDSGSGIDSITSRMFITSDSQTFTESISYLDRQTIDTGIASDVSNTTVYLSSSDSLVATQIPSDLINILVNIILFILAVMTIVEVLQGVYYIGYS
jgi:hypothetical protein